jgi:hypothetical protein
VKQVTKILKGLFGQNIQPQEHPRQGVCHHEQPGDLIVVDQEGSLTEPLRITVRCRYCSMAFAFRRMV